MYCRFLWILTCLLGWVPFQTTSALMDSLESHCKLKLIEEVSVLVAPETYAFVYADTTKEASARDTKHKGAFLATSPLIFNSKGLLKKIAYDSKTGETTVPVAGSYQVVYSIYPFKTDNPKSVALAVNGKEVTASRIKVSQNLASTARVILKLAQGDQVSLILPDTSKQSSYLSLQPSINASLLITKL